MISFILSRSAENGSGNKAPGWAGYNSLVSSAQSGTLVGALPLLPEVAQEWSTMLTVIYEASQLRNL
ncbi:hypothetical protein SK128_008513, partial [Halocaridina rubra]